MLRIRLNSYENYINGELQRFATDAEDHVIRLSESFPQIQSMDSLTLRMEAAGIDDNETKTSATDFLTAIDARKQTCLKAETIKDLAPLPDRVPLIRIVQFARNLARQTRSYEKDAKGQNRPELQQRNKDLASRKWLHEQRQAIDREVERLSDIQQLRAALELTSTTALSRRKSVLTDELITSAYINRFECELKKLGAHEISVELKKTHAEIGRVYHRVSLRNVKKDRKTTDILSEGEFRIVSLAAFLADTEGRSSRTPFVFDDPISSLDHVYEEQAAKRLVKLSESRQVIAFTHRLSLVGYLMKYAEKNKTKPEVVCLSKYIPGDIADLPIDLKSTDKAVNSLLNERLAVARKALDQNDARYEIEAKALCSDIRVLIERVVEMDLLNEVVRRFSQEVNTKGKINALSAITEADCRFIDEYMTKYSRYEHSQPEETPVCLPQPAEIESDLNSIKLFINEIRQRKKD
jgi:ABC-type dipeptide/oligopeptide/nickel transport system ATPase subunit